MTGGGEEWTGTVMSMHRGCVYVAQIFCAWCQVCGNMKMWCIIGANLSEPNMYKSK